jgi:hypothetical protein
LNYLVKNMIKNRVDVNAFQGYASVQCRPVW